MMTESGPARFERALAGEVVTPPARGLTFVAPSLLPGPAGTARPAAAALAHAAADLRLDFAFVPSWEPWALEALQALRAEGVAALWVVPGVWWPTLEGLGVETALRTAAREPSRLAEALEAFVPAAIESARAGIAAGADALVVADDLAGDAGPFVAPALLAAEVFPRLARIASVSADADRPAVLHSDGDMRPLLPLVRGAGFAALHGDLGGAARVESTLLATRAEGLGLIGGLPTPSLSDPLSGALAGTLAVTLALGGGLLVADDGGLSTTEQVEALFAALGTAGTR